MEWAEAVEDLAADGPFEHLQMDDGRDKDHVDFEDCTTAAMAGRQLTLTTRRSIVAPAAT